MPKDPIKSFIVQDDGTFPNSPLPLLFYQQSFAASPTVDPTEIKKVFHSNNWMNSWRNGLYPFHHYHSTAHETLGIYSGWVEAQLGGPNGETVKAMAGDVIIVPAGVAHKNVDQSPDFKVVGAYPKGQIPDMKYGKSGERPIPDENIKIVAVPECDPVYGKDGVLMKHWSIEA